MARQLKLKAMSRKGLGKGPVKRLRAEGVIPAVLYGPHTSPESIGIGVQEFRKVMKGIHGHNVLVDLEIDQGGKVNNRLALVQDVQHHPVADMVLHVDFREVSATEKFRSAVQIRAVGEPAGVKNNGGVLEAIIHEVHVQCLPKDLPEAIEVNVELMEIGASIHIRDITPPAGVELLDDPDRTVFIVAAPLTEEAEAAAAGTTPAEPEVIGAKKEDAAAAGAAGAEAKPGAKADAKAAGKADAKPAGKADAKPAGKADAKPAGKADAKAKPEAKK
jgi:large subunit ribosomal protein L25